MRIRFCGLLILLLCSGLSESAAQYREAVNRLLFQAQSVQEQLQLSPAATPSAKKALFLSLLLPGLGHRYANNGSWGGVASAFAAIDVGLWAALIGGEWRRDHLEESYTTLAASKAGAKVDGKDRFFFLNVATYRSSEEFLETILRNRAWDQIDYVQDVSFQWSWSTESDFVRYRSLREDAESLRRRRAVLIASLVANRLISGLTAARRAGKRELRLSLGPPVGSSGTPTARVNVRF